MSDIERKLCHTSFIKIMLNLHNKGSNSQPKISKEEDITYTYLHKAICKLEKSNLIEHKWIDKREKEYFLTDLGKEVAEYLYIIHKILKNQEVKNNVN